MRSILKTLIILIVVIVSTYYSFAENPEKKLIIFLINRMDIEDIENMPFIYNVAQKGCIGLMNIRGNDYNNEYSCAATIGSGTRTDASSSTSRSYNIDDKNINIYQRRTGYRDITKKIANFDIVRLIDINKKNNYNPIIGALGSSLKNKGIKTAVIGNSDTPDDLERLGVLIAMDEYGLVDYGDIGDDTVASNSEYPFGVTTNYKYLLEKFKEIYKKAGLIIIELGDINRLEKYKNNITDDMYAIHRKRINRNIDRFIERINSLTETSETRMLILSLYPSINSVEQGKKLTPVIIWDNKENAGIITSDTTRRSGIIGNIDVAPYIAQYFKSSLKYFTGRPFYTLNYPNNFEYVKQLLNDISFTYKNRVNILYTFAVYEIIVSIISFVAIQMAQKYKLKLYKYVEYLLLSTMVIPFVLLILPIFNVNSLPIAFFAIILITVILILLSLYLKGIYLDNIIFISGLVSIPLIIDVINNSRFIKMSFLGYDPIIGARYYGIGNEYMGILIGSILVFSTSILDRYDINKLFTLMILIFTIIVIGFPKLGANVGGTITSIVAFAFVILKLYCRDVKLKHYFFIFLAVFIILLFIALIDLFILENESHFGLAITKIMNGGYKVLFSIIIRKVSMNIKLFKITIWSKVLLSSIIFLGVLFYRPFGVAKRVFMKHKNLSIGLFGILVACIVGFFVNDSGVVAAATSMIFLAMTLMYLIFNEIKC